MVTSPKSYHLFQADADSLYQHFLDLRKLESPLELLERFRLLFTEGLDYPDPAVRAALYRLLQSSWADREFQFILNRCCYILINHWWLQSDPDQLNQQATAELIRLLDTAASQSSFVPATRRLRVLLHQFTQTEHYASLQRRGHAMQQASQVGGRPQNPASKPLRELIHRYPYLYPYCLLDSDSSETGHIAVRQLQVERERQFERDLMHYTTHLVRRSSQAGEEMAGVANPTLLSHQQLQQAIRHFAGRVQGNFTHSDLAYRYHTQISQVQSYREVKHQIYDYLTTAIDSRYGERRFNRWLADQLTQILPQNEGLQPSYSLLLQTCGHLLDKLVASPQCLENHLVFVDLNSCFGATFTVGLLLKIVLLCRSVKTNIEALKAHLTRRFAIMFKHYETKVGGELQWLVECLENLSVALSIHFGQANLSYINLL